MGTPSRVAGWKRQLSSAAKTLASMAGPILFITALRTIVPLSSIVISTTTFPSAIPNRSSGLTLGSEVTAGSAGRISSPVEAPSDKEPYGDPAVGEGAAAVSVGVLSLD